jgi:UDP-N-acetylmuramyl pentapeptide phosphotransferase/UDP-N-acetylglucosamine-1-phosphate transferase
MTYFYLLAAFAITSISLAALRPIAKKFGLLYLPGGRKTHLSATMCH